MCGVCERVGAGGRARTCVRAYVRILPRGWGSTVHAGPLPRARKLVSGRGTTYTRVKGFGEKRVDGKLKGWFLGALRATRPVHDGGTNRPNIRQRGTVEMRR